MHDIFDYLYIFLGTIYTYSIQNCSTGFKSSGKFSERVQEEVQTLNKAKHQCDGCWGCVKF